MSPEQNAGRTEEVDARSDVWSLGVMLFELIAGKRLFEASNGVVLPLGRDTQLPRLVEVEPSSPVELAAIVNKALQHDVADRYQDGAELARELEAFRSGAVVSAHDYSAVENLRRTCPATA